VPENLFVVFPQIIWKMTALYLKLG